MKTRSYEIQAKLVLLTSKTISAESLEAATEKAKGLKEIDFVDIHGDFMDGGMRITGIYESNPEMDKI